jgi:putative MATE family efflux protein
MSEAVADRQTSDKFIRMTSAPVEGLIIRLALPSIAIMIVSALYNMADTFFVGYYLGTSAVAAVGIAFPLMAIIQAMGFFFGQGSGNYVARALGARQSTEASRMAATGFVSSFVVMAIIAAVCLLNLKALVMTLGATATIAPYAQQYIFFILLASPWMVASTVLNQLLRFQGSASIAMAGMISGAILNIALDPLFIFVFNMGIKGAAAATMISQMFSFAILLFYASARKGNIPVKLRYFSPAFHRYLEMFRGGIPALLRQGLMSVASIVINHFAGAYGDEAIAAISIVQRLSMCAGATIIGFGQGFQPVCGFSYGAKLYDRVKKGFWFCVKISAGGMAIAAVILAFFAPHIIAFFRRDDPEVIRIGTLGLRLQCISMPLIPWVVCCNMMTQTIGKAFYASLLAVARQGLFLIPSLLILVKLCGFGLFGIQISLPLVDLCGFVMAIPIAANVLRSMKNQ